MSKTGKKKQFLMLGKVPLIVHTLRKFQDCNFVDEIVLVVPDEEVSYCEREIVSGYNLTKVKKIVLGGKKRQDSVFNGLQGVAREMDIIVVHDGVRPFMSSHMLQSCIQEAKAREAAVVAIPVKDTVKRISSQKTICEGISRESLWRVQTPQVFKKEILNRAFLEARKENFYGTDESTLVARLGIPVYVVEGSELNIKITTPEDIVLGEGILAAQENMLIK